MHHKKIWADLLNVLEDFDFVYIHKLLIKTISILLHNTTLLIEEVGSVIAVLSIWLSFE